MNKSKQPIKPNTLTDWLINRTKTDNELYIHTFKGDINIDGWFSIKELNEFIHKSVLEDIKKSQEDFLNCKLREAISTYKKKLAEDIMLIKMTCEPKKYFHKNIPLRVYRYKILKLLDDQSHLHPKK